MDRLGLRFGFWDDEGQTVGDKGEPGEVEQSFERILLQDGSRIGRLNDAATSSEGGGCSAGAGERAGLSGSRLQSIRVSPTFRGQPQGAFWESFEEDEEFTGRDMDKDRVRSGLQGIDTDVGVVPVKEEGQMCKECVPVGRAVVEI